MVARFHGRIAQILKTNDFSSLAEFAEALRRYTHLYLYHIPQRALNHQTPMQA
ncbi:MAG TPA: hypothetical protein EYH46_03030 [Sulfurivirga caldicuralii]|nr:hypothetical protein [Sulfurivirga caldicuralii]